MSDRRPAPYKKIKVSWARCTLATQLTVAETGDQSASNSTVADVVDFVDDTVDFVAGFGDKSATTWIQQLVAVDIVVNMVDFVTDTVNFCWYGRRCRQCVQGQRDTVDDFVDFQQSRPCWIQLCR